MKKNHFKHIVFSMFIGFLALSMANCEMEDLDHPPLNELDSLTTLDEVRSLYTGQSIHFDQDISIFATVTMDELSGNIYREVFVQDSTAAINLRLDFAGNLKQGDSIRLSLKGAMLTSYNNMLQLDSMEFGKHVIRQGEGTDLVPKAVTIPDILGGGYQAQLVKLEEVQFAIQDVGEPFAGIDDDGNPMPANRDLLDCDQNRIIVRTSSFADFAFETIPSGNGTLVAIVSQFGNTWQLLIRDPEELDMEGERCELDEPQGSGTFDDPYNVAHAIAFNDGDNQWVEGYIIGVMETTVDPFEPSFEAPFETPSNIIIADNPDETSIGNALIVQLLVGDIRNALNLVNNPENLGKQVKLHGDLATYFGQPGMRNTSGYWMDGDGIVPQVGFWDVDFGDEAQGLQPFTAHSIVGNQEWERQHWDGGSAVMSGFAGGSAHENEDWLISPSIDLTDRTNVTLEIREAINYITSYDDLQVLIAADYDGEDPTESGTWELFEGFNRPPGGNWTFVDSGSIDISQFDGETIHIAFKYNSTTAGAATWQISEVKFFESE